MSCRLTARSAGRVVFSPQLHYPGRPHRYSAFQPSEHGGEIRRNRSFSVAKQPPRVVDREKAASQRDQPRTGGPVTGVLME
jgi:hypothetical protein